MVDNHRSRWFTYATTLIMDPSEDSTEADLTQDNNRKPWHPRLTAYRLLVLTTTIGLGTFKAIATSRDLSLVSTTVEWIWGVVLFSVLSLEGSVCMANTHINFSIFILGLFEPSPPSYLCWLLQYDLMQAVWKACRIVSLTPPEYRTDEEVLLVGRYPPITGYRVLCSVSVSVFGTVKASLAYRGAAPTALNVVDYCSGLVLVSLLYVLGMYENNTADLMPYLFSTDYSPIVAACGYIIAMVLLHLCGFLFFALFARNPLTSLLDGPVDFRLFYDGTPSDGPPTFLGALHNKSTYLLVNMSLCLLSSVMAGLCLLVIGLFLYSLREFSIVLQSMITIAKGIHALSRFGFRQFFASRVEGRLAQIFRFIRRFGLHILCYTAACALTGLVAFFCAGVPFRVWYPQKTTAERIIAVFNGVVFTVLAGGSSVVLCWFLYYLTRLLMAPFLVDWTSPTYQRTALELCDADALFPPIQATEMLDSTNFYVSGSLSGDGANQQHATFGLDLCQACKQEFREDASM